MFLLFIVFRKQLQFTYFHCSSHWNWHIDSLQVITSLEGAFTLSESESERKNASVFALALAFTRCEWKLSPVLLGKSDSWKLSYLLIHYHQNIVLDNWVYPLIIRTLLLYDIMRSITISQLSCWAEKTIIQYLHRSSEWDHCNLTPIAIKVAKISMFPEILLLIIHFSNPSQGHREPF